VTPREFALACVAQKAQMLRFYSDPSQETAVARVLDDLQLTEETRAGVLKALDLALTDAFYSLLLALDGCAALGSEQEQYRLYAADGQLLTGELEAHAFEVFHGDNAGLPPNTSLERTRDR
jgi:hypothetical protein